MIKYQEILNLKDKELKKLLLNFYVIHPTDIDDEFYAKLYESTDEMAIKMKQKLALLLEKRIANEGLIDTFKINDDFKYTKKIAISDNLLFTTGKDDYYDIYKKITGEFSMFREYEVFIDFIRKQGIEFPIEIESLIHDFLSIDSNSPYYDRKKSKYLPFIEERQNLRNLLLTEKKTMDYSKEFMDLRNKTLGNVGEYYVDDYLNNILNRNARFVSKDIGDGTGYDHHYMLNRKRTENNEKISCESEMLVEDKSTVKENNGNDYFLITNNEYKVMLDSININHRTYTVARAFINPRTITCSDIILLRAIDDKLLAPINTYNNDEFNYIYDHEEEKGKIFRKKIK